VKRATSPASWSQRESTVDNGYLSYNDAGRPISAGLAAPQSNRWSSAATGQQRSSARYPIAAGGDLLDAKLCRFLTLLEVSALSGYNPHTQKAIRSI
jgi:hypothetical protein